MGLKRIKSIVIADKRIRKLLNIYINLQWAGEYRFFRKKSSTRPMEVEDEFLSTAVDKPHECQVKRFTSNILHTYTCIIYIYIYIWV